MGTAWDGNHLGRILFCFLGGYPLTDNRRNTTCTLWSRYHDDNCGSNCFILVWLLSAPLGLRLGVAAHRAGGRNTQLWQRSTVQSTWQTFSPNARGAVLSAVHCHSRDSNSERRAERLKPAPPKVQILQLEKKTLLCTCSAFIRHMITYYDSSALAYFHVRSKCDEALVMHW